MNTKTITTGFVALLMIIMALAPTTMNVEELNDNSITGYDHGGEVPDGTATLSGILTVDADAWDSNWTCEGGLYLPDYYWSGGYQDVHYASHWEMNLTGAGSYYTSNAPEGEWAVVAVIYCIDDDDNLYYFGGQFEDSSSNPQVNLTNDTTTGDISFTLFDLIPRPEFMTGSLFDGDYIENYALASGEGSSGEYGIWDLQDGMTYFVNVSFYNMSDGVYVYQTGYNDSPMTAVGDDDYQFQGLGVSSSTSDGCYYLQLTLYDNDTLELLAEYGLLFTVGDAGCDGGSGGGDDWEYVEIWVENGSVESGEALTVNLEIINRNSSMGDLYYQVELLVWSGDNLSMISSAGSGNSDGTPWEYNLGIADGCYYLEAELWIVDEFGAEVEYLGLSNGFYFVVGSADCFDGGEDECPFENVTGSPCEPVATNPCYYDDPESSECYDYVMEYCATHTDDPGCDDMGEGDDCPFEDVPGSPCEPVATNPCFADHDSDECMNYAMEYCATHDDPACDDMGDDGGDGMDCDEAFVEFHLETMGEGGVNFVFNFVCHMSVEQSDEYREMIDMYAGNGDGDVSNAEVAAFMEMMLTCHDEDGTVIECDNSCHNDDGDEIDCDEDAEGEQWSINGNIMEMYQSDEMEWDRESVLGDGSIITVNAMSSGHVDLADGEETVTVTFVNNDDEGDDEDDECFEVRVLSYEDWSPTNVTVEDSDADWIVGDANAWGDYEFYGCATPDTFSAVFEYTGDGHPNGVENLPPICEFKWFMATDTTFEDGHLVTEGPDGDVEIDLDAGSYMISVWCIDAEMDPITVTWSAPTLNLTNTFDGDGEVNGWVMFVVPPGLSEEIVVPYSWTSEEWSGSGEFIITLDSGEGDGDLEGDGGGLPGFTSLMTITALLGAVFFLGRRN